VLCRPIAGYMMPMAAIWPWLSESSSTWLARGYSAYAELRPRNVLPFKEKFNHDDPLTPFTNSRPTLPMSLNQRGRIVGQVVRPGVSAPDRKQRRLPTAHPQPPMSGVQDIIEISSDEDEDLQPPPKRLTTKRGHPTSTHEMDYKTRLCQKDLEIEKLKKVRHQRRACGFSSLTLYHEEGERVGAICCVTGTRNGGKEVSKHSRASNPPPPSTPSTYLPPEGR